MSKTSVWVVQIVAVIFMFFSTVSLAFEVNGHMNPDNIMIEAVIIGICLFINILCALGRLYIEYTERKK
ncbi:MAG: hypothetical protein K2M91_02065 [Lachnospiraceae bacterium]|nr:hypothetical protein [Lachnospiraceae bacterium]